MNYSQLERFSGQSFAMSWTLKLKVKVKDELPYASCKMIHLILKIGIGLLWRSFFASNDIASLEFNWCWLAITLHAKIKAHLRIITIKISKISYEKFILLSTDIIFQTFTCVFFVLFHTFVQKPLHKPDLHISNSVTTRNDLDMFLQGIASNASCPNGNLDPMRVVVGNLRICLKLTGSSTL